MSAIAHIRKNVLKVSQVKLADIAGVTQATVSRWERGELQPDLVEMARIRDEARRLKLKWSDALFFAAPPAVATERPAA